jgi:hypothetical protein
MNLAVKKIESLRRQRKTFEYAILTDQAAENKVPKSTRPRILLHKNLGQNLKLS